MHEGFAGSSTAMPNVGAVERWVCGILGALLVAYGVISGRSWWRYASIGTGLGVAYRGIRGHCGVYRTLGIDTADRSASATTSAVVTFGRSAEEIYAALRQLDCLPALIDSVQDVRCLSDSEFEVRALICRQPVTWHVSVTADRKNEFLAWHASAAGKPGHTGQLSLVPAPGRQGTEVDLQIQQEGAASPAGVIADHAAAVGWRSKVSRALRRLKQQLETGEIASTTGQPAGSRSPLGKVLSPDR
ncbi:MAG: DUF2892 domain-containing protein [Verrucomicrobia bacterium]|nr:DUF2892 domain-containing protein [Verrucomicrobiota bacterium]